MAEWTRKQPDLALTGEGCDPTLEEEERREHAPMSEDELINLIDGVLREDDKNNDGYIDYARGICKIPAVDQMWPSPSSMQIWPIIMWSDTLCNAK